MKKKITITVFDEEISYNIPSNPKEFMKYFQDKIDLIPEEYKDIAIVELNSDYGEYNSTKMIFSIDYERYETDEEREYRELKIITQKSVVREKELNQLKKLREKYNV